MITQQRLKELLDYDPNTGTFVWMPRRWLGRGGQKAGSLSNRGYIRIFVDGRHYLAHRLAWLYQYGIIPKEIDHANGSRSDNRISNLRESTRSQNTANKGPIRAGLKGAYFHKRDKWRAQLRRNNVLFQLGTFKTELEAHKAYAKAAIEHFGEFARAR